MQRLANGAAFVRDFELSAEITAKGNARADLIASIQNTLQNQGLAWDHPNIRASASAACNSQRTLALYQMHRLDEALKVANVVRCALLLSLAGSRALRCCITIHAITPAAEEQYRQLSRTNPELPGPHLDLYNIYSRTGKEADAIKELQQGLSMQGATDLAAALPSKYASAGFPVTKEFAIRELIRILTEASKQDYISPIALAVNYAVLDEKDKAFEWLEKAYEERAPKLLELDLDPDYDNLRTDKRFDELNIPDICLPGGAVLRKHEGIMFFPVSR